MPNWRRAHVPGGSYFFTVATDRRASFLTEVLQGRLYRTRLAQERQM